MADDLIPDLPHASGHNSNLIPVSTPSGPAGSSGDVDEEDDQELEEEKDELIITMVGCFSG